MKYLKNVGISIAYIIGIILVLTLIVTVFNYFNIFSDKLTSILKILIPVIGMFSGGIYIGKNSNKKGFIEGIKLGLIFSILLIIFNFTALNNSFKIKYLLFYLIIVSSSILGSMVGINLKRKN